MFVPCCGIAWLKSHLPVIVERCVDRTVSAVILILGCNWHELLIRMFLLRRIICLAFLEVRRESCNTVNNGKYSHEQIALTFPSPSFVAQRFPTNIISFTPSQPIHLQDKNSPSTIILLTSPHIHQIINRATTPQHLTSRLRHGFPSSTRLRYTLIAPVIFFASDKCRV
jgi:hypothetical protein